MAERYDRHPQQNLADVAAELRQSTEDAQPVSAELFWHVLRQRDLYRNTREAAIGKVEVNASQVRGPNGNLTGYFIDADTWREVRALLRMEPRESENPTPPEEGKTK